MRRFALLVVALGVGAGLAACSGGRSGSVAPAPLPTTRVAPQNVSVSFTITLPPRNPSARTRSPRYVSAATQSATVTVTPAGGSAAAPAVIACTLTTCSGQVSAPVGSDTFGVTLFDQPNGTGHALSTGSITQTIVLDAANTVKVTFNGIVAGVSMSFTPAALGYGAAGSANLVVDALDADGNTIVGPGIFVDANGNPITISLSSSDTSGSTRLATTSLTQPTAPIAFTASASLVTSVTITAAAPGAAPGRVTMTFACGQAAPGQSLYAGGIVVDSNRDMEYVQYPLSVAGTHPAPLTVVDPNGLDTIGLAVDAAGRVYSAERGHNGFAEFCPNASGSDVFPYRSVAVTNLLGYAVDPSRNFYALSGQGGFGAAGTPGVLQQFGPDPGTAAPLNAPVAATPVRTITGGATGLGDLTNVVVGTALAADDQTAYVAPGGNEIFGFGSSQNGNVAPNVVIANTGGGLLFPYCVAVDPAGNIYVLYMNDNLTPLPRTTTANVLGNTAIAEYAAGNYTMPIRILAGSNLAGSNSAIPVAIAVGADDTLYVLSDYPSNGQLGEEISLFSPTANGNASPTSVFTVPSGLDETQFAVDGAGIIYLGDIADGNGIYEYARTGTQVGQIKVSANGLGTPTGIAVDPLGNVVVQSSRGCFPNFGPCTHYGIDALLFFPAGTSSTQPTRLVNDSNYTGGFQPIASDSLGDIFVLGDAIGTTVEFAANAGTNDTPIAVFLDPLSVNEGGIAVDPAGDIEIAVPEQNTVYVYGKGTAGNSAGPQAAYADYGAATLEPVSLALDAAGNLYVVDRLSTSISVFPPGATAPSRTIVGPHTRLDAVPAGIAVDSLGAIYTSVQAGLFVFAPGANGDVAPSRIVGTALGGDDFFSLAVGPAGTATTAVSTTLRGTPSGASAHAQRAPNSPADTIAARARAAACARVLGTAPATIAAVRRSPRLSRLCGATPQQPVLGQ
jgi:hypothetical protein